MQFLKRVLDIEPLVIDGNDLAIITVLKVHEYLRGPLSRGVREALGLEIQPALDGAYMARIEGGSGRTASRKEGYRRIDVPGMNYAFYGMKLRAVSGHSNSQVLMLYLGAR